MANYRKYSLLNCLRCNSSQVKNPNRKYCSVKCARAIAWNRGKSGIYSDETRRRMSESRKGKHYSPSTEFKKGMRPWCTGTKGLTKVNSGSFRKGERLRENSTNWKGGVTFHPSYRAMIEKQRRDRKRGNGGRHTVFEWETLKKKHNNICLCCGYSEPTIKLTRDHIIPIVLGGSNDINNIQPLCMDCNIRKNIQATDYVKHLTYVII